MLSALPDLSQHGGDAVETSGVLFRSEVSRSQLCISCNRLQLSVLKNSSEYLAAEINTPAPVHVEQGLALAACFPHRVSGKRWLQHGSAPAPGAPRGAGGICRGVRGETGSGHGVVPAAACESRAPPLMPGPGVLRMEVLLLLYFHTRDCWLYLMCYTLCIRVSM